MSMLALCAGLDLTIRLRDCEAPVTLLRCTILVKVKNRRIATDQLDYAEKQAKWPDFC
jgi:hypothetical protein